jgi:hypothetical protein
MSNKKRFPWRGVLKERDIGDGVRTSNAVDALPVPETAVADGVARKYSKQADALELVPDHTAQNVH